MAGENLWGFGLIPEPVRDREPWEAIPDLLRTGIGAYQTAQQREAQRAAAAARLAEGRRQFDVAQRGLAERAAETLGFQREEAEEKRQAALQAAEAARVKEAAAQRISPLTDWDKLYGKAAGEYPEVTEIQRELATLKPHMVAGRSELPRGSVPGEAPPIGPLRPLPDVFKSIADRTPEALRRGISARDLAAERRSVLGRAPPTFDPQKDPRDKAWSVMERAKNTLSRLGIPPSRMDALLMQSLPKLKEEFGEAQGAAVAEALSEHRRAARVYVGRGGDPDVAALGPGMEAQPAQPAQPVQKSDLVRVFRERKRALKNDPQRDRKLRAEFPKMFEE